MTTAISFENVGEDFQKAFLRKADVIATAAMSAMQRAADLAKQGIAQDIAAAGFSTRWQRAVTTRVYPERAKSIDAALFVAHRIRYASIFETGGTIRGQPFLWLPLPTAQQFAAGQRPTPSRLRARGFELVSINRPGRLPLLAVERRGPFGRKASVPVFVGISTVTIPKRFHFFRVCEQVRDRLPSLYSAAVKDD